MKTKLDRREFLALSAAAGLAGYAATPSATKWTGTDKVKALLLHLGHNMWCEWLPEELMTEAVIGTKRMPDFTLAENEAVWRKTTAKLAEKFFRKISLEKTMD